MRNQKIYQNKQNIDPNEFYEIFKLSYKTFLAKEFDEISNNSEPEKFVKTLILYFLERQKFIKSPLLNPISIPSLDKGLLVIGKYGTGKSSVFKTFHQLFFEVNSLKMNFKLKDGTFLSNYKFGFSYQTTNQIVKDFESISTAEEKKIFWEKISKGTRYFDDLTTEKEASNFGKLNVMEDVLEMRYSEPSLTFASMNYSGNTVESTLDFLATKYGERVYDRIFEMFNIIELKGKSFRK